MVISHYRALYVHLCNWLPFHRPYSFPSQCFHCFGYWIVSYTILYIRYNSIATISTTCFGYFYQFHFLFTYFYSIFAKVLAYPKDFSKILFSILVRPKYDNSIYARTHSAFYNTLIFPFRRSRRSAYFFAELSLSPWNTGVCLKLRLIQPYLLT